MFSHLPNYYLKLLKGDSVQMIKPGEVNSSGYRIGLRIAKNELSIGAENKV